VKAVSVVLPIRYVHAEWLKRSINSVLEQDYSNLELIVVNDEATEDIDELISSFGIKKYFKNDRNRKLPYSLNRGFKNASGDYHTWTSADNVMLPGMITRLVSELEEKDLSIVCGRSSIIDENDAFIQPPGSDDERIARLASCNLHDLKIEPRFTYYSSLGACFLYRKEVWESLGGYDEGRHGSEDFDFWLRASHQFKMGRLPWNEPPLYLYRVHSSSISATVAQCYTRARLKIVRREAQLHPENHFLKSAVEYYRGLTPRRGIKELLSNAVQAAYVRSVQMTPAGLKRPLRSLLKKGKQLAVEPRVRPL